MKPVYSHDCPKCKFLGHHAGHDLYICLTRDDTDNFGKSVIARKSSEEGDYASSPVGILVDNLARGFKIRDLTVDPPENTNVPSVQTTLLIMALALARNEGIKIPESKVKGRHL